MTRRQFLLTSSLLAVGGAVGTRAAEPIRSLDELRVRRRETAARRRRVIFNNDGNEPVYLCQTTAPEELLRHRTSALAGTHVDAIFYCTWSSGFGLFTHDTKVGQVFSTREGLFEKNLAPQMIGAGTDPLRVMTDFGAKRGIEVFWSFRVNDTHDGGAAGYGPIMFRANRLKQEHPEWLISTPQAKPKFGAWSAVDYARPEIRDLAFRFVEEVCRNYAVTGVELDFFRHPVLFKRAAMAGAECNDEERGQLTELMRRIRAMTEAEGLRRGRPLLIAVRVPDSVEYCRAIGIDLERWIADGLVDLVVTGGYFQLNEPAYTVALGRKHGVPVYPSLDESRVRDPAAKKRRSSTAAYRGRALNALQAGAAGVYLFNAFNPKDPIWSELGSREALAAADKDYFASVLGLGAAAGGAYPHKGYVNVPTLNPAVPLRLQPGTSETTSFLAGDAPSPTARVTLHLQLKQLPAPVGLTAQLNGRALPAPRIEGDSLEYDVPPAALRAGRNEVHLQLAAKGKPVDLVDLMCSVRGGKGLGGKG